MRILAIDPGTHCGWSTWDGAHVESGVQTFDLKRGESPGMRFLRFRTWLREVVGAVTPLWKSGCPECGNPLKTRATDEPDEDGLYEAEWICPDCGWHDLEGERRYPAWLFVYEQAHHRGGAATEILVGMTTRIQEFAAEIGAEHVAVHSGTLKKWATGSGRAGKPEMIVAANRWRGYKAELAPITDDNEADAVCLLAWAREGYGLDHDGTTGTTDGTEGEA